MIELLKRLRSLLAAGFLRFWERHMRSIVLTCLIALFALAYFWNSIFISIYPGQKGVLWTRFHGGVSDRIYGEGLNVIYPWDIMYIYDLRVQERHIALQFLDTSGLVIKAQISVRFRPDPQRLHLLHRHIGPDYMEKVVFPDVTSAFRVVLGGLNYQEIFTKPESELLAAIRARLSKNLEANFIIMDYVLLENLELPETLQAAIQEKQVYEQILLSYKYRLETEEKEVERKKLEGKGIAAFEAESGVAILQWAGIEATAKFAESENSKIIIIGTDSGSLPVILSAEK